MLAEVNGRPDGVSIRWRSPGADHDNWAGSTYGLHDRNRGCPSRPWTPGPLPTACGWTPWASPAELAAAPISWPSSGTGSSASSRASGQADAA